MKKMLFAALLIVCGLTELLAHEVVVTGKTSNIRVAYAPKMTLYAKINGKYKRNLCKSKKLRRSTPYTFKCNSPVKEVESITIIADHHDAWWVKEFIFELPNGDKWSFVGSNMILSNDKKDIYDDTQQEITFYFTGSKAGTIDTRNPYHNKKHRWEKRIKGTKSNGESKKYIICPKCKHKILPNN